MGPRMTCCLEKPQPVIVIKKPHHSLEVVRFKDLLRVPGTVLGFTDVIYIMLMKAS